MHKVSSTAREAEIAACTHASGDRIQARQFSKSTRDACARLSAFSSCTVGLDCPVAQVASMTLVA